MKKLKLEHMQAVGEIANSIAINQTIETLEDWMQELPDEFEKAKEAFERLQFEFENGLNAVIDKSVDH